MQLQWSFCRNCVVYSEANVYDDDDVETFDLENGLEISIVRN